MSQWVHMAMSLAFVTYMTEVTSEDFRTDRNGWHTGIHKACTLCEAL